MIFAAVGLPADKIPVLLTIDWFLDRCRTTSNVLGDMTVAVLLDRTAGPKAAEERVEQEDPARCLDDGRTCGDAEVGTALGQAGSSRANPSAARLSTTAA